MAVNDNARYLDLNLQKRWQDNALYETSVDPSPMEEVYPQVDRLSGASYLKTTQVHPAPSSLYPLRDYQYDDGTFGDPQVTAHGSPDNHHKWLIFATLALSVSLLLLK